MADLILKPLTALGHGVPEDIQIGPYLITERCDVALASVATRRGRGDDLARTARAAGLPLPPPARAETGTPYSAFWVAPDMWFAEAAFASHQDIAAQLKTALGDAASVTEQTDAWVRFDIAAATLTPLLERLTNLDIAAAPTLHASRTVIDHLGCYLIKRARSEVTLYGPRSSAANLLHAIEVTARSIL